MPCTSYPDTTATPTATPRGPASDDEEEIGFGYFGGDDSIFSDGGDPMVVAAGLA